jgi:hypothetical protein
MHTSTAQSHTRPHSHHHAGRSAAAAVPSRISRQTQTLQPAPPRTHDGAVLGMVLALGDGDIVVLVA